MYHPGELEIAPGVNCELDEDGHCEAYTHLHPTDERAIGDEPYRLAGGVYLPHSCDSWIIGGPDQIRALIADLEKALKELEG